MFAFQVFTAVCLNCGDSLLAPFVLGAHFTSTERNGKSKNGIVFTNWQVSLNEKNIKKKKGWTPYILLNTPLHLSCTYHHGWWAVNAHTAGVVIQGFEIPALPLFQNRCRKLREKTQDFKSLDQSLCGHRELIIHGSTVLSGEWGMLKV